MIPLLVNLYSITTLEYLYIDLEANEDISEKFVE